MLKAILSFPYQLVHAARSLVTKRKKLPRKVISVGNLSFGGTGKTPVTIAIAKYLRETGLKVCVLTRGYKSKAKTSPLIVSSLDEALPSVEETGDEALEMLEAFREAGLDITVSIDPNRHRAGIETLKQKEIDVFILDDGRQHIALERDIDIILKNQNESGFYREFPWNESQADFLIHTKVDDDWLSQNKDKYSASFNLSLTKNLNYENGIGVFTAIADPSSLEKMIKELIKKDTNNKVNTELKIISFSDHHSFSIDEVTQALSVGITLITTKKDLVKIPKALRDDFVVARLELEFMPKDFLVQLRKRVQ